jgi:hypothetical protein
MKTLTWRSSTLIEDIRSLIPHLEKTSVASQAFSMGEVPVDCRKMAGTGTLPEWTGVALVVQQRDHRGSIDTVDRYPAGAEFEARIASPELKTVRSSRTIDRLF